jgi:hypothetical protein
MSGSENDEMEYGAAKRRQSLPYLQEQKRSMKIQNFL